jgi:hypothetical protein
MALHRQRAAILSFEALADFNSKKKKRQEELDASKELAKTQKQDSAAAKRAAANAAKATDGKKKRVRQEDTDGEERKAVKAARSTVCANSACLAKRMPCRGGKDGWGKCSARSSCRKYFCPEATCQAMKTAHENKCAADGN